VSIEHPEKQAITVDSGRESATILPKPGHPGNSNPLDRDSRILIVCLFALLQEPPLKSMACRIWQPLQVLCPATAKRPGTRRNIHSPGYAAESGGGCPPLLSRP